MFHLSVIFIFIFRIIRKPSRNRLTGIYHGMEDACWTEGFWRCRASLHGGIMNPWCMHAAFIFDWNQLVRWNFLAISRFTDQNWSGSGQAQSRWEMPCNRLNFYCAFDYQLGEVIIFRFTIMMLSSYCLGHIGYGESLELFRSGSRNSSERRSKNGKYGSLSLYDRVPNLTMSPTISNK